MTPILLVREAFGLAYGEVPEGATELYVGYSDSEIDNPTEGSICPTTVRDTPDYDPESEDQLQWFCYDGEWMDMEKNAVCWNPVNLGPDISTQPAHSFRGFFGEAFDAVLDANLHRSPEVIAEENKKMRLALRNIQALAIREYKAPKHENSNETMIYGSGEHFLRFCEEGGVTLSPLRGEE